MHGPTPLAFRMWPRSPTSPSLMSAAAVATPRSARPSATRGVGVLHADACRVEGGLRQRPGAAEHFQRQPRVAQRAAHVEVVAGARPAAQQGLSRRDFAEHRDADGQRAARGVAADQLAIVGVGQREQSAREALQPGLVGLRQGQRQREGQRFRAAGGQVAQVHGQRLVAQLERIDAWTGNADLRSACRWRRPAACRARVPARRSRRPHPVRRGAPGA